MKKSFVTLISYLMVFTLLMQTSPIQASINSLSAGSVDQRIVQVDDQELPSGLTKSEWQGIQGQIRADISQEAYLKASNTGWWDEFGRSVAISGDTIVVGAYYEDSNATGVNGNQKNNLANNSGAAYVFVRSDSTWSQQAYLKASNTEIGDDFGYSVAISGDTIVIGAHNEDSNATGVDGNQADNSAAASGAAYVFVRSGSAWSQQAYLKASNTEASDYFGRSVAISGDTIVVGAYAEDSAASGVNGNQSDNTSSASGAVYVFERSGSSWTQQAYLKASNSGRTDAFGISVAISVDTIVVGAYDEDSAATGVNGAQNDESAYAAGAAYIFTRSDTMWFQQAYLKAHNTNAGDYFGNSVDISEDTVVVGAYQGYNSSFEGGSSYVFIRSGTTWSQQAYLNSLVTDSDNDGEDDFGNSVSVSGNLVVIGCQRKGEYDSGAAYVFFRRGTTWSQQAYLKASNSDYYDRFGHSVAVSGETIVVGAIREDSDAIGINGDQDNNNTDDSGAAYVFSVDQMPTADLEISHIEVNQATQNIDNSIPLIAGKQTQVSAFVTSLTGEDVIVTGVLRGFDASTGNPISISPIKSQGPGSAITQGWSDTFVQSYTMHFNHTLEFLLPYHWTTYYDSIIVEIELMNGVTARKTLDFLEENYLIIKVVPILFEGSVANTHFVSTAGDIAKSMFPLTHIFLDVADQPLEWKSPLICSGWPRCREVNLISKLNKLKNKDDFKYDFIVGILPESLKPWLTEFAGITDNVWPTKDVALIYDSYLTKTTFAHELGHLLNQKHVRHDADDCVSGCYSTDCTPSVLIPDWPYATTSIQEPGYDQMNDINYFPSGYDDVMTYCNRKWVSPFRYTNILSNVIALNSSNETGFQRISVPSLEISGIIFLDGTLDIDPIWFTEETPTWENPEPGTEYCVQALDLNSIVLNEVCFDLEFIDLETLEPVNVDAFDVHLPYNTNTTSVAVVQGESLLIERSVSLHAPTVLLTYPIGGENWSASDTQTITWQGSDEDLDPLFYSVFYSFDGGTLWSPLALDLEETYLEIDASTLAGSTYAMVKIEVTDGINYGFDTNDTPFTVEGKPPSAEIISPLEGQSFVAGGSVQLQGIGNDTEDGFLDGAQKCWSSDLDGYLGCGEIILTVLSPGTHVITMTVEDLVGNSATDTTTILVEECFLLLTNTNPSTAGSVSIDLTPNCIANPVMYASGTVVQLNIDPNQGFDFLGWSGNASGTDLPLNVTITSDLLISAKFTYSYSNFLPMIIR